MFRLLSKESNIFSVPVYIIFLLLIIISFNVLNFNTLNIISAVITFLGVALGYILFNKIALNYQHHLPLFLYTFFIFALYPGSLDIGIAVSLFTNSFLLLLLTSQDDELKKSSYLLVGSILAVNYLFLPTTYPMVIFVLLHLIGTSDRVGLNIFRLFFGIALIFATYFGLMYFFDFTKFDEEYLPNVIFKPITDFYPLYILTPVAIMMILAVADHFANFNRKSPTSKFKYGFLLNFTLAQLTTVILYMGKNYEYLLLLAFPLTVIISRYIRFRKNYWLKEVSLWIVILCLILFKITNYFSLNQLFNI